MTSLSASSSILYSVQQQTCTVLYAREDFDEMDTFEELAPIEYMRWMKYHVTECQHPRGVAYVFSLFPQSCKLCQSRVTTRFQLHDRVQTLQIAITLGGRFK